MPWRSNIRFEKLKLELTSIDFCCIGCMSTLHLKTLPTTVTKQLRMLQERHALCGDHEVDINSGLPLNWPAMLSTDG